MLNRPIIFPLLDGFTSAPPASSSQQLQLPFASLSGKKWNLFQPIRVPKDFRGRETLLLKMKAFSL